MKLLIEEYAEKYLSDSEQSVSPNPKPNSFWVAWYECLPTVIQFTHCGEYFYALGQDEAWHKQHAELIQEINVWEIAGLTNP
jgi:hypothetical protein